MGFSTGEFISTMTYTIMLFIAHINQTVIPAPLVGMNNRIRIDLSADNCLEGLLGTVGYDLGIYFPSSLEDAEYRSLASCTSSALSFDATGTEVGFVDFHFA